MSTAAAVACPRCGGALAASQEYCLQCGLRRPGPGRFGAAPVEGRPLAPRLLALAVVALAGAGAAVALTRDAAQAPTVITATGGSVTVEAPSETPKRALATWPEGEDGWTIVIVSVPKVQGRQAATDLAGAARTHGLQRVGVTLHPQLLLRSSQSDHEQIGRSCRDEADGLAIGGIVMLES